MPHFPALNQPRLTLCLTVLAIAAPLLTTPLHATLPTSYRFDILARDGTQPASPAPLYYLPPPWTFAAKQPALDDDGFAAIPLIDLTEQRKALWLGDTATNTTLSITQGTAPPADITLQGALLISESPAGVGLQLQTRDGTPLRHAAFAGPLNLPGTLLLRPRLDAQSRLGLTTRSSSLTNFAPIWVMESSTQQLSLLAPDGVIAQVHPGTFTASTNPLIAPASASMMSGVVTLTTNQRRLLRVIRNHTTNTTSTTTLLTTGPAEPFSTLSINSDANSAGHITLPARTQPSGSTPQWRLIRIEPAGSITTIAAADGQASPRSLPLGLSLENTSPAINTQGLVTFITPPTSLPAARPSTLAIGDGQSLLTIAADGQTLTTPQGTITLGLTVSSQRISFLAPPAINAQGQVAFLARLADASTALILATPMTPSCPADLGSQGGDPSPDQTLDNNDFIVFINLFFSQDPTADLGSEGGSPGPDAIFDNNDFILFIQYFFQGC